MTWYPDMGRETMIAAGDHVRAVGWLHPDHPYSTDTVPPEFVVRLKEFVRLADQSTEALYWGICMGLHTCEFCERAHGLYNVGVPAGELLFVAPEMIVHYVEHHRYAPPKEFVAAVLAAPLPDSPDYQRAVECFRQSQIQQLEDTA